MFWPNALRSWNGFGWVGFECFRRRGFRVLAGNGDSEGFVEGRREIRRTVGREWMWVFVRERGKNRVLGFEKWKGYYGKRMPIVGHLSHVQQHGSINICSLIKGSNGQISQIKLVSLGTRVNIYISLFLVYFVFIFQQKEKCTY